MLETWFLTVLRLTYSWRDISWLLLPSATRERRFFSLGPLREGPPRGVAQQRSALARSQDALRAPVEASSGEVVRHRLSRRGDRQLNYALHMIAICQIAQDTRGRAYYRRKLAEGKSGKETL